MCDSPFLSAPADTGGKDLIESLNPNSLKVLTAIVEPSLANAKTDDKLQFERHGYFVADQVDHRAEKPVFILAVGMKDSWGKIKIRLDSVSTHSRLPTTMHWQMQFVPPLTNEHALSRL